MPHDALECLTDAYSDMFQIQKAKKEEIWKKLVLANKKQFPIVVGTNGPKVVPESTGLDSGHAYSLDSVYENIPGYPGLRLLKIRNPWGKFLF